MSPKNELPLGTSTPIPSAYSPEILFPIERKAIGERSPIAGLDRWDCFEVSWLDGSGKPAVTHGTLTYSRTSSHLVESKSLKLYLAGFHQEKLNSEGEVLRRLHRDLEKTVGGEVSWQIGLTPPADTFPSATILEETESLAGVPGLSTEEEEVSETLASNIFRSLCPVTAQPDWATVVVRYRGKKIKHPSLQSYLASFRNHQGFHEECGEEIFEALRLATEAKELVVGCFFTRRGGIAISPIRWLPGMPTPHDFIAWRHWRQ